MPRAVPNPAALPFSHCCGDRRTHGERARRLVPSPSPLMEAEPVRRASSSFMWLSSATHSVHRGVRILLLLLRSCGLPLLILLHRGTAVELNRTSRCSTRPSAASVLRCSSDCTGLIRGQYVVLLLQVAALAGGGSCSSDSAHLERRASIRRPRASSRLSACFGWSCTATPAPRRTAPAARRQRPPPRLLERRLCCLQLLSGHAQSNVSACAASATCSS